MFWSRGEEIAAWSQIHEVERQLVTLLAPLSRVLVRAQTAEGELRIKAAPAAVALADRIRANLQALTAITDPGVADPAVAIVTQLIHELAEGLAIIYGDRDTGFAALMEWQNKAMWLSTVALLIIVALALVFEHEWLFLIGAAGGLMSRLARSLFRDNLPTDYGASWTTLFLSPLVGAIAAWFGILMIAALVAAEVLGPLMAGVRWPPAFDALTIALAFTLGFSERLFTTLVATVEAQVKPNPTPVPPSPPVGGGGAGPVPPGPGGGAGGSGGARPVPASTSAVQLLDLTPGERAAVIGDQDSPARQTVAGIVGAGNVFAVNLAQLATVAPVDAVLLERPPDVAELEAAAATIREALATERPRGRHRQHPCRPVRCGRADAPRAETERPCAGARGHDGGRSAGAGAGGAARRGQSRPLGLGVSAKPPRRKIPGDLPLAGETSLFIRAVGKGTIWPSCHRLRLTSSAR